MCSSDLLIQSGWLCLEPLSAVSPAKRWISTLLRHASSFPDLLQFTTNPTTPYVQTTALCPLTDQHTESGAWGAALLESRIVGNLPYWQISFQRISLGDFGLTRLKIWTTFPIDATIFGLIF